MRQYAGPASVNAAKIIAVQRTGTTVRLIYDAPEAGTSVANYADMTLAWMQANDAAVGGYLVDKGDGTRIFVPAAAFEAIYTLVTP